MGTIYLGGGGGAWGHVCVVATSAVWGMFEGTALIIERMQAAAACSSLGARVGPELLWLNEGSLRSNIPQTALVTTLDTYDF
jgi:hypothetical protein